MRSADRRGRLGADTLWLLVGRLGTQGLMVLLTILLARRLGQAGLGEYAFIASAVLLANVLTSFGTDMFLVREIAATGDLSRLPAAIVIQLALSALAIALALVGAPGVPGLGREAVLALQVYSVALIPLAAYTVFAAALRGLGHIDSYTALNLAIPAAQLAGVALFVPPESGVLPVAVVLLASQGAAAIFAGALCTARIPRFWSAWRGPAEIAPLARASSRIALLGVLGMLYQRSGVFLLATISGPAVTGSFSAAQRAVEASKTGHLAFFGALYPALSRPGRTADASRVERRSLWSLLFVSGAAALALAVLADPLVLLLYGPDFASAAGALRILAWVLVPYTVSSYVSLALVAARRERPVAEALVGGLAALVVLAVWLIPRAGLQGACWATLAAEVLQASVLVLRSRGGRILPEMGTVVQQRELPGLP